MDDGQGQRSRRRLVDDVLSSQPLVAWTGDSANALSSIRALSSMAAASLAVQCCQQGRQRGRSHGQHNTNDSANALVVGDGLGQPLSLSTHGRQRQQRCHLIVPRRRWPQPRCQHMDDSANAPVVADAMASAPLSSTATTNSAVGRPRGQHRRQCQRPRRR